MCELGKTLKLCTCSDEIDKSRPYWTLARKVIKQPPENDLVLMGEFTTTKRFDSIEIQSWIIGQLNSSNCFDFDYEPLKGDKLIINLSSRKFEFEYSNQNQAWKPIDEDDPFLTKVKRVVQAKGYIC
ncbi:MAG: hypothetical protein JJV99_12990 [Colwellia sp.]|nr:hypothetical protein [Colwellia sp.]